MAEPAVATPIRPDVGPSSPSRPQLVAGAKPAADESFAATWRADLKASVVVFLVALPLCLGIALASGAPLFAGIITGVVGGLVVSWLSGSQLMVSGPAAGLTAIVAAAIIELGSFPAFLTAVVIGGALQLVLWRLRAGIIAYFFPSSVIKGMLAAIGIIIVLKQLPYAFGAGIVASGGGAATEASGGTIGAILAAVRGMHPGAALIAFGGIAVLALWELPAFARAKKAVPAPLLVVTLGTLASVLFGTLAPGLALPPESLVTLPDGDALRGALTFPDFSRMTDRAVIGVGVTLALVASLETLLSLEATDKLDPLKRTAPANRELMAQGVGNMLAGLIGGLPMTGVIVRSAANVGAGGMTWRSSFTHGVLLAVSVVALVGLLNLIPLAALAAILIYTGFKLAHPKLIAAALRHGPAYYIPFVATIVAILATDLLVGITIGLTVGAFFVLRESYRNSHSYQLEESADHHRVRIYLAEEVSFLNRAGISKALGEVPDGCVLTVDGNRCRYIDPDVVDMLHEFQERAALRGITLRLVGVPSPVGAAGHH